MHTLVRACALFFALPIAAQDDDPRATDLDRRMMAVLPGRHATVHARYHFDPGDVTTAQRDAAAADIEAGFAELERVLDMRYAGKILVFLYKDHEDLEKRTGSGAVAFSTGTVSLHQPHDFRGVHELTHLFAMQFPRTHDAWSDLFVVEGLATILAATDQGVPIHAWAAVYLQTGRLPGLVELRQTFPKGAGEGVHPYHVAGSFVGFLIERFGVPKVKAWYMNATEAQHYFGKPFKALEREWREWLASAKVEAAHRNHVLGRLGLSQKTLPDAIRDAKGIDLLASRSLAAFAAEDASKWSFVAGVLRGEHDGAWTHLHSKRAYGPRVAVRARLRLVQGDAIKLRCNRAARVDEAIFAAWSTYVSSGEGFVGNDKVKVTPGVWQDVVFVHERGTCRLFWNGVLVLEASEAPSQEAGSVGIGVEKGIIEVSALEGVEWK